MIRWWRVGSISTVLTAVFLAVMGAGNPGDRSTVFGSTSNRGLNDDPFLLASSESRALLDSARYHLFGYRMDKAEALLDDLDRRPDGSPAAWYFRTSAALHRALMSDRDEHFEAFEARRDSLLRELDPLPRSKWRDYMRAEASLWEAVAQLKRGRYVRAALVARSAYGGFSHLAAAYPDFYEAYKGLGLLHLGIGSMPPAYRFVLKVLGYGGTISQGLEELRAAHDSSAYNREEAGIYLAFTNTMLFLSEQEGLRIIESLYQSDPQSTLYAHLYGFMLISNRRTAQAADVLRAAVRRSETPAYFYDHYLDFYLAESLFRNDEFAEAEPYYRQYIERHPGPALKALAHLGLGLSLEMQGKRAEAVEFYGKVRAARSFDTDEASGRAAARLLASPVEGVSRELLLGQNAYDSGRLDEAVDMLSGALEDPGATGDQKAEASYRLGRVYQAREAYTVALAHYGRAIDYQEDPKAKWAPWGWFYIGKIWMEQDSPQKARDAFERARSYKGRFDYYQALDQSIRAALERM